MAGLFIIDCQYLVTEIDFLLPIASQGHEHFFPKFKYCDGATIPSTFYSCIG